MTINPGQCIDCRVLTEDGVGCAYLCKPCQLTHVWPLTFKELQQENEALKARILRLEERIAATAAEEESYRMRKM